MTSPAALKPWLLMRSFSAIGGILEDPLCCTRCIVLQDWVCLTTRVLSRDGCQKDLYCTATSPSWMSGKGNSGHIKGLLSLRECIQDVETSLQRVGLPDSEGIALQQDFQHCVHWSVGTVQRRLSARCCDLTESSSRMYAACQWACSISFAITPWKPFL